MDNSLDESSLENDRFLAMLRQEETVKLNPTAYKPTTGNSSDSLLHVNRSKFDLTLLQSQSTEESVIFSNSSASPIRMRFNECPFQISSNKSVNYLLA